MTQLSAWRVAWCVDHGQVCNDIWWCGLGNYWQTLVALCLLWSTLFVVLLQFYRLVRPVLERWPSTYREENSASWFAVNVQSTIHAASISILALRALASLRGAPHLGSFGGAGDDDSFRIASVRIANLSQVFHAYMIVDTGVTVFRKAMTLDYLLHHFVFCFFCWLLQFHCFATELAGYLLVMEVSTVFLNGFLFWRSRLGNEHWLVQFNFLFFAGAFIVFRLMGTTHIAWRFIANAIGSPEVFGDVPTTHLNLISCALVLAIGVQLYWAFGIGMKFAKFFATRGRVDAAEDAPKGAAQKGD